MIKIAKWLLVGMLSGFYVNALAESTKVTAIMKNGEEKVMVIESTGAISFSENNMKVLHSASSSEVSNLQLSAIQKLLFEKDTYSPKILEKGEMILYPAITSEYVYLFNAGDVVSDVEIFNMDGKVVLKCQYVKDQSINVSSLPVGMYILKVGNKNFKFEKK